MTIKERIVENSIDLFMKRGCKSVTMDEIASENGISKRTLYENFEDKNSLLKECLSTAYERTKNATDQVFNSSENVYDLIFKIHECKTNQRYNFKMSFVAELKKFYPEVYESMRLNFSNYHNESTQTFIDRGQKEGLIMEGVNKEIIIRAIITMSDMMMNGDVFSSLNATRRQIFQETILLYIRGISTKRGIELLDNYLNKSKDEK
ncbi:MAG: TetR/AcrR family transcriptional regulator [Bacteroidales bacterium]|nr:TetR/AcrR family transcriptional regulator [Bacteroidales bacterium]